MYRERPDTMMTMYTVHIVSAYNRLHIYIYFLAPDAGLFRQDIENAWNEHPEAVQRCSSRARIYLSDADALFSYPFAETGNISGTV